MVIFHSYVKLPEGILGPSYQDSLWWQCSSPTILSLGPAAAGYGPINDGARKIHRVHEFKLE